MKVLIVNDDSVERRVLSTLLRRWNYESVLAGDGTSALEAMQHASPPLLVLLEQKSGGIDGIELCKTLKQTSEGRNAVVVMMGGFEGSDDMSRSIDAGADEILKKPYQDAELGARLRNACRTLGLQKDLQESREALRFRATHDILTGLHSKAAMQEFIRAEKSLLARRAGFLSMAVVDLDFFKRIYDTHGLSAGDAVIQEAANRIGRCVRAYDKVGRVANQEFVLLLPNCAPAGAQHVAERIRSILSQAVFQVNNQRIPLTASIGVACAKDASGVDLLLVRAERALFSAKRGGSNRVVLAEMPA